MVSASCVGVTSCGLLNKFGRAHKIDTLLAASELLRHNPRIVFAFIGGGHRMDELARIVQARGLDPTFRFIPYQDRTLLKHSLSVADIHWISLKPAVEGMIVPSKFYGIAAAGRPKSQYGARWRDCAACSGTPVRPRYRAWTS